MFRRAALLVAVAALLLSACSAPGAPAINDPREIINKGLDATTKLKSFHLLATVDGKLTVEQLGGNMSLSGTKLEGDFNVTDKLGHATFEVPPLLGITGEVIATADASYVKTSLTGDKWQKQANPSGSAADMQDPAKALAQVKAFLDKDGVDVKKLADAKCGEATCYQVEVTIPSSLLDEAAHQSAAPMASGTSASDVIGESLVVDLQFDRSKLYLTSASTSISSDKAGTLNVKVTLSNFDKAVTVTPPASGDVTESPGGLTLPGLPG